jgi:hypothetical protein
MNKGVIFVRVSKREQDYQRQLEDLRALAKAQNLEIIAEIAEKISGVKDNQERDGVQELLRLAQKGIIQKVLVQEVSRLGRSTVEVLKVLEELTSLHVSVYVQNFGFETLKAERRPKAREIQSHNSCLLCWQNLPEWKEKPSESEFSQEWRKLVGRENILDDQMVVLKIKKPF